MRTVFYLFAFLFLFSCNSEPLKLNVMSFNIRLDHSGDSLNNWQYRKDIAAQVIKDRNIDVLGTQEVLMNQLNDLKDRLAQYNVIGVGRQDGKDQGEACAIFYKKEKFNEIKSGHFWLSETPDVVGAKGWDAACERIATWVILQDKESQKQFFFINTHLDHMGQVARIEGVKLLLQRTESLSEGLPVIITGDFNATPESDVIKTVKASSRFVHTKDVATDKQGTNWTFHGFGKVSMEKREFIDYIFTDKGIKVNSHMILSEKLNDIFISDHSLVEAQLEVK